MKTLNPSDLHKNLTLALESSIKWQGYNKHPEKIKNSYKSAYFVYQVGLMLNKTICELFLPIEVDRRQICFDGNDNKITGEWLLDIVWTEEHNHEKYVNCTIPRKILCALECESSTSYKNFFIDFAKLSNVISPIKIFLAGLNQKTPSAAESYRNMRLSQAAQYIESSAEVQRQAEWFLCFWPSPKDKNTPDKEVKSIWEYLKCKDNAYSHLNCIYTYKYIDKKFFLFK
jgi:hypothetical protein